MRNAERRMFVAAALAALVATGVARADNNPNGMVFRAVGWFRGEGSASGTTVTCTVPTTGSAIPDGLYEMGLWNTFGSPTLFFPDRNNGLADPCGAYLQLQNNLIDQAIQVDHIALQYKIPGARRFRQFVPARNGFPIACRRLHHETLFIGAIINPINSTIDQSGSGTPNTAFVQMLPLVTPQLIGCLRGQYAPLSTDLYTSLSLVIRATVFGQSDSGDTFQTNPISFTLNLRHTCGNGRVDDGEECDPNAPSTCLGVCVVPQGSMTGACSNNQAKICRTDTDCEGLCSPPNNPTECVCLY